ncbi:MAG: beta-lactamase family protein [Bacteroidetes bacterium]|nr:beta-lactamase family protein [Bacteroidota bacterium]
MISRIIKKYKLPSVGYALLKDGNLTDIYVEGVRKISTSTRVTPNDKYHIGSCTKAMTATLVAIFIKDGLLSWKTKLKALFPYVHPDYESTTIEMLLAHRGGISNDLINFIDGKLWNIIKDKTLDPVEGRKILCLEMLTRKPFAAPGSKFIYSNAGYTILGAILETISNSSWENLLKQKLFKPLKMNSSGFGSPANPDLLKKPNQPWGHNFLEDVLTPCNVDNPPTIGPAGSVHCTIGDWLKFIKLHLDGSNEKSNFFEPDIFFKLHKPYPKQKYTYGGWIRLNRSWADGMVLTHAGSNNYNHAKVLIAPVKNSAILIFMNYGGQKKKAISDEIIRYLVKQI